MTSPKLVCKIPHSRARWPSYGAMRLLGSSRSTTICCTCASLCAPVDAWLLSEHRHRYGGRGSPVFTGVVVYERYGRPDMDVYISRSEGLHMWSGPPGY